MKITNTNTIIVNVKLNVIFKGVHMKISLNKVRKIFYGPDPYAFEKLIEGLNENQRSYLPEYSTNSDLPGGSTEDLSCVIAHFLLNK
jgi:hypothetical protein